MHLFILEYLFRVILVFIHENVNGRIFLYFRIHLFRNPSQLPPHENLIVQEYLDQPYILDGYKIDLRLYVLVTHCDPLKAFIYRDGLVRLGTEKYTGPSNDNMVCLTVCWIFSFL